VHYFIIAYIQVICLNVLILKCVVRNTTLYLK